MTLTGVALIVLPLLAVVFKLVSFGWLSVFLLFGPVLLLAAGYALQIVIASQAFLSGRSPMPPGPGRVRATIAAWLTSLSAVLLSVFVIDGGDTGYGSTFQVWLGVYDSSADPEALHAARPTGSAPSSRRSPAGYGSAASSGSSWSGWSSWCCDAEPAARMRPRPVFIALRFPERRPKSS